MKHLMTIISFLAISSCSKEEMVQECPELTRKYAITRGWIEDGVQMQETTYFLGLDGVEHEVDLETYNMHLTLNEPVCLDY